MGNEPLTHIPTLVIDTAESSRNYSVTLGPTKGSVSLGDEEVIILHERTTQELAAMARRNPCTRRDAEKLDKIPPATSKEGAGGQKIFAVNVGKAEDPLIVQSLSNLFTTERNRCRYGALCDQGTSILASDVLDVNLFGSGFGSTAAGLLLYIISRIRYVAKLLGLKIRVHVILTSPSVAKTHDVVTAWGAFGATCKEVLVAMTDAARIEFGLFTGAKITHEPGSKLLDTFTIWGCSTGNLVAGDRDEVASSIGLLLFYMAHSQLGGLSESAFCDPQKTVLDTSLGYRGIRRLGLARFAIDRDLNREIAFNAAILAISRMLNRDNN
ncbi:MAG: hypothetical protein SFY81_08300 [Verrucomicrobiota bacterium]|nr:hypothetical protein [Verrucomicrobiota bacterium]